MLRCFPRRDLGSARDTNLNKQDPAMEFPLCSILVVNYNGKKHLDRCLRSFEQLDYPADRVEILLVDNGSTDNSEVEAESNHPRVRLIRNPANGFAAALNLGTSQAKGSYVAFANNDVFADPAWLTVLVRTLEQDSRAGCAGGKILFENGRINSVGHKALPDFYWEDEGYDQVDSGQYDFQREVEGLCWALTVFRRACLDDVGPIDEDYVLYYEDVDTSLRCRQRGWKILYTPDAKAQHVFHGSTGGSRLTEYFCDRGRLIYVAKYHPEKLATAVQTTRFLRRSDPESLYDTLPVIVKKLIDGHPPEVVEQVLDQLCDVLVPIFGALAVDHLLGRMQVVLGHRKMSVGFYDQALHVIGGGQKYGCTLAAALQRRFDVTLLANRPIGLADLQGWYGLPLSGCRLRVIPVPFFDKYGSWVDSAVVTDDVPNPFEAVAAQSKDFDIFVNVNMLTMVRPLSPFSIFVCHFPDTPRRCYFAAHEYSALVVNSLYTAQWVKLLWGLEPDLLVYPPVEMEASPAKKENLILSVARFEPGGSKKQRELIQAFEMLRTSHPDLLRDWRLVLVGGSLPQNAYLEDIERMARESTAPVEVRVNVPISELQGLYAKAKIFWHACGLGEKDPRLIEHFGMTTVEAMQNRCVPVVIDGGGQREIVEHGRSGYRFNSIHDLCDYTLKLIATPELMERFKEAAYQRGQEFTQKRFEEAVDRLFRALEEEYRSIPVPDPSEILRDAPRASLFYSPVSRRDSARLQQIRR
jgi:GT2 family glycosyltransferase/glycosyltransferase involved in cell wall biosynthesis